MRAIPEEAGENHDRRHDQEQPAPPQDVQVDPRIELLLGGMERPAAFKIFADRHVIFPAIRSRSVVQSGRASPCQLCDNIRFGPGEHTALCRG